MGAAPHPFAPESGADLKKMQQRQLYSPMSGGMFTPPTSGAGLISTSSAMANAQMVQQGPTGGFGAPSLGMSPGANYMSLPGAQTMSDDGEAAPDGEIPVDGKLDRPCASCRLSRVRCNRVFPCQRCVRLGLECKQPRKVQRGRPSHKARLARAQAQAQQQHEHHMVAGGHPHMFHPYAADHAARAPLPQWPTGMVTMPGLPPGSMMMAPPGMAHHPGLAHHQGMAHQGAAPHHLGLLQPGQAQPGLPHPGLHPHPGLGHPGLPQPGLQPGMPQQGLPPHCSMPPTSMGMPPTSAGLPLASMPPVPGTQQAPFLMGGSQLPQAMPRVANGLSSSGGLPHVDLADTDEAVSGGSLSSESLSTESTVSAGSLSTDTLSSLPPSGMAPLPMQRDVSNMSNFSAASNASAATDVSAERLNQLLETEAAHEQLKQTVGALRAQLRGLGSVPCA